VSDEINLRITGVESAYEVAGARRILLRTTRGPIPIVVHAASDARRAAVCLGGAIGGFDGPSHLYARLGFELARAGITVARTNYRAPNEFGECVLDALATLSFLRGTEHERIGLIGHSFGAAVAINAGTLSPAVATVVALSSQLGGAHVVGDLAPRPLLLVHGTADTILSHEASQVLYDRAREPKELRLLPGADHRLAPAGDEVFEIVRAWIREKV
jgi:hypothetical protein